MNLFDAVLGVFVSGFLGGFIGVITGLGGASISTPIMTSVFEMPVRLSIATSFSATVATSVNGSIRYIREKITNLEIGIYLMIPTLIGVVIGVDTNLSISPKIILITFGSFLILMTLLNYLRKPFENFLKRASHDLNISSFDKLIFEGEYYDAAEKKIIRYKAYNYVYAVPMMILSGFIAGLLGIGGGAVNVIALRDIMKTPVKVSVATSLFIIGFAGSVGSVMYWRRGFLDPLIASVLIPGIILGSYVGSTIFNKIRSRYIRIFFDIILFILSIRMILQGLGL
ncbi:MAG: sulfite exporter TauE/SafE family protein [Desulfurococcales archaeon]|jgi:uncharacterized membrane protein YfcA|nr:sulfite exporter TauE/SafE family protein [Desulfurococcales archaeon]